MSTGMRCAPRRVIMHKGGDILERTRAMVEGLAKGNDESLVERD